jgi:hypothetical protein
VPVFCIEITGVQLDVLVKIKEFLERSLGFDRYSLYKLKNSSFITVTTVKARNNSKSSVALTVKNIRVLNNYLVPFLDNMTFLTPARPRQACRLKKRKKSKVPIFLFINKKTDSLFFFFFF